jgi:Cu+-exporting ATPase
MSTLESEGKTVMILALEEEKKKEIAGLIAVADTLKESSPAAITALKELGIETIMLTGDNEKTANAVAKNVGINRVIANVLPQEKAAVIKELQSKENKVVAMVGDGINDAPALAQADIGIAIGIGSDIAKETGGIILIKDDIMDVVRAIKLSRATMRKIRQNLFWALIYNSGGIPIAALGLLSPIFAAAAMALSSISVIANSSLLKRLKIS